MKIFLHSLLFNICFFCWAMLSSLVFAPLFVVSENMALRAGKPWADVSLWLAEKILGITCEVRGQENITYQPVIYASKHQSAWDTLIFLSLLKYPAYVLKRELLSIPLWGWYLWRMGMIAIDRSAGASSIKHMIKQAKRVAHRGRPIVIFPEGTRKTPGAPPRYHPGTVALYSMLHLPVIPVALNSGVYWGKDAFFKRPGKIIIEFLPPIAPGLDKQEFSATLERTIETASQRLLEEATLATLH